jgi:HEAT repeat protein
MLTDKSSMVRACVVRSVGQVFGDKAAELLLPRLEDINIDVQIAAINVFVSFHNPQLDERLISYMNNHNPMLRLHVVKVIGRTKNSFFVPTLISLLDEHCSDIRLASVISLGQIADNRAVTPLVKLLKTESNVDVCYAIAATLHSITGQSFGDNANRWEGWLQDREK